MGIIKELSVVTNIYNEEERLPRFLNHVKKFAEEIVVVDQESTDKSAEVARKLGGKVFKHKKLDYVEPARNFAIAKATKEWILVLDVDEELPFSLVKKIEKIVKNREADYFRIPRKNFLFGKWLQNSRWWPDYNIRFFRKGSVVWNEVIHSVPMTEGKGIDIDAKEEFALIHNNYTSINQYLEKMTRYTSAQAGNLVKSGYKFSWKDLITKPAEEFFSRYFSGEGYKDGLHGLSIALLQSFSELVVYLKVWEKGKFEEANLDLVEVLSKINEIERNAKYWQADARLKRNGSLVDRVRRKFKF